MKDEVWHKIFKDFINCYNAIKTLKNNEILDLEYELRLNEALLVEIIETFKSEVEE